MPTLLETQQEPTPAKKRIGHGRFLLEFLIAAILIKVGATDSEELTNTGLAIHISLAVLGFAIAIWATTKRLRDIKRSVWWIIILIAPLPIGLLFGALDGSLGSEVLENTFLKTFGVMYMIVYFLFLGVLIFWPSAFHKATKVTTEMGKQSIFDSNRKDGEAIVDKSVSDIEDRSFAQAAAELDTDRRDSGVWARAYSDAEGDDKRARALYIRYRAKRING